MAGGFGGGAHYNAVRRITCKVQIPTAATVVNRKFFKFSHPLDRLCYNKNMLRAVAPIPLSNQSQAASSDQSKCVTHSNNAAGLYARCRRLEQRLVQLETAVATTRRDVWRIEKSNSRAAALTTKSTPADGGLPPDLAGLFGGR